MPCHDTTCSSQDNMDEQTKKAPNSIAQDQNASNEARKAALEQMWKNEFSELTTAQQQTVLYNLLNERLYWRIILYMRRFPERLTSSRQTYSDRCIGSEEFMAYMGYTEEDGYSVRWLNSNHVPPAETAISHIVLLNAQLAFLLSLNSDAPITSIRHHFNLNDIELEILASLVGIMSEESLLRMMTVAWADFSIREPTVTFLSQLIGDTKPQAEKVLEALNEHNTLRHMRLVIAERHALFPNYTPRAYAPLTVEQAVIDAFKGRRSQNASQHNMLLHRTGIPKRSIVSPPETLAELEYALQSPAARISLIGSPHSGRRTMLCSFAAHAKKRPVLEIDVCREFENIPTENVEIHLASILREALFDGAFVLLRMDSFENNENIKNRFVEHAANIAKLISDFPGEVVILTAKINPIIDDAFSKPIAIHIQPPTVDAAQAVWKKALAPWCEHSDANSMADIFSQNYVLPIGSIFAVVKDAVDAQQAIGNADVNIQSHHILNEIRKSFRHQLGSLADITVSDVPLSGVVLPKDAQEKVDEILKYAKNLHNVLNTWGFKQRSPYGNALSVLFSGPPGTGKTLLACALANELGKVLYRVDLSRIVDKYIGETEKNLGRIFDEAAKAQAIILFDEADSLFAKRTEVKSSNDRYANLEINFLLQKLESYNGMTILTTNLSKGIDEAFRRRLRFIVDFPMPDVSSRIELWKRMLPPNAPVGDDIRWAWLAHTFEMSGGYIRNAMLKAAIAASSEKSPICMQHLAKAAADEARSMGKLMRIDEDYDDYDDYEDDDR